jgi:hypothetical protein
MQSESSLRLAHRIKDLANKRVEHGAAKMRIKREKGARKKRSAKEFEEYVKGWERDSRV